MLILLRNNLIIKFLYYVVHLLSLLIYSFKQINTLSYYNKDVIITVTR